MRLPTAEEEKKKATKEDVIKLLLCIIFISGVVIVLSYIVQLKAQHMSEDFIRRLATTPKLFTMSDDEVSDNASANRLKKTQSMDSIEDMLKKQPKINFWALQSMNPDIKAWIQIPDTPIDYPVLNATKEEGQDYYLRRNYEKKKNNHGSIYIQTGLSTQFDDTVTVIYGHNMKDGTMFGWLHHLSEETTAVEHPEMYIYLPERTIKAELLSCYTTDDRLVSEKFNDFSSAQDRLDYIYTFENKTALCDLKENDIVNGKCKLITLSTCTSGGTQRELAQYLITDEDYHEQETGKN